MLPWKKGGCTPEFCGDQQVCGFPTWVKKNLDGRNLDLQLSLDPAVAFYIKRSYLKTILESSTGTKLYINK